MKANRRMGRGHPLPVVLTDQTLKSCPLCGAPIPWWGRRLKIHRDYYYLEGGCPACLRTYDLLLENGPRASYHRACLLEALEKAQGGAPHG